MAKLCQITPVNRSVIEAALANNYKDFEDEIQYHAAVLDRLDAIITRNPQDFQVNYVRILTPEQLLQIMN